MNATDRDLLLDGFPRTVGQARLLDEQMKKSNRPLNLVINLNVPEELILQRIEGRWYHPPSVSLAILEYGHYAKELFMQGRVYNDTYNPPQRSGLDDMTGEPLEKRVDDSRAVFGKRIRLFNEQSQPMLDYC